MTTKREEMQKKLELKLLTNFLKDEDSDVPPCVEKISNGQYEELLCEEFCSIYIQSLTSNENLEEIILNAIQADTSLHIEWLCMGVASLLYFVQCNWTGPENDNEIKWLSSKHEDALKKLSLEDECNENTRKPELLYFAKLIFSNDKLQSTFESSVWWLFRANLLHQMILEEGSATLFDVSETLISKICKLSLVQEPDLEILFNLEATYFYLHHKRIQNSEKYLEMAQSTATLNLELIGVMGKRTRYQQEDKAQLYLKIKMDKDRFPSKSCDDIPKALDLNDDLRLERIEFSETSENVRLGATEEAILLAKYFQLQISQPKDKLTDEEIMPYLTNVIDRTKNWSLKISSLYQRCILESNHKRTIERSLSQIEYLTVQLNNSQVSVTHRLDMFFASNMKPTWTFKQTLANLMLNLGMVKGALDLYLKLRLWDDVIVCYTILELKHKAAEIIRQEISKKPTVKLWCLLGDATQDVNCYETAWKLSEEKSSRVQRHWGFYYFAKKNYEEAVPHLKLSAELNNIQENVWIALGFAALQIEDWKLAATAYRHYCALEQMNFEAWNNLAKAYIKLEDKPRAWHSLQDAIKCNYDRWEIWDNLMIVSIDLGHFSEVIRCYHRILELKGCHVDLQVLRILTKAIVDNINDADGNPSRRLTQRTLELFGRLTSFVSNNSDIWQMYAKISTTKETELDNQKAAQYMQRAHRFAVADPRWFQTIGTIRNMLELCSNLATVYLTCCRHCSDTQKRTMLGSAKLSLQGVLKKVKDQQWLDRTEITEAVEKLEEYLKIIVDELKINSKN